MVSDYTRKGPEELGKNFKGFIKKALDSHVALDTIVKACLDSKYNNIYRYVCDHGGERYAKQTIADILNKPVELIWPRCDVATNGGAGDPVPKIDKAPDRVRVGSIQMEEPDFEAYAAMDPISFAEPDSEFLPPALFTRVEYSDFFAYMPEHRYIFVPTRVLWPAASVNARLPPKPLIKNGEPVLYQRGPGAGEPVMLPASQWLDQKKAVEQMTWAPGEPTIISGRMVDKSGWIERENHTVFNLYRSPLIELGDASKAGPWIEHVKKIYPTNYEHLIKWFAQRRQKPGEKINHALVLAGMPGIGKDSMLEPVKRAVGPWNCSEISPIQLVGRFSEFLKSVILCVNEARDRGEMNRYEFYEHLKTYTAAPPNTLRVDAKNIREYEVFNCCGVIITTNHRTDGIFLPTNDRRHYVAWSDATMGDFSAEYWNTLWGWYDAGGDRHVAAYLAEYDLSGWNEKAPPPKTAAFWDIVDANRAPEESELSDVIDKLDPRLLDPQQPKDKLGDPQRPNAVTLEQVAARCASDLGPWLRERKNRRAIPFRFAAIGYTPVRNEDANDGLWKVYGKRQVIYAKAELTWAERLAAARDLIEHPPALVTAY